MRVRQEDHPIVASIARLFNSEIETPQPLPRPKTLQPPETLPPVPTHQRPSPKLLTLTTPTLHQTPTRGASRARRRINVADLGRPLLSLPDPQAREDSNLVIETISCLIDYPSSPPTSSSLFPPLPLPKTSANLKPKYPSPLPEFLEDTTSLMCSTTPGILPLMSLVIPKPNLTPIIVPTPVKKPTSRNGSCPTRVKHIYLFGNQSC